MKISLDFIGTVAYISFSSSPTQGSYKHNIVLDVGVTA